MVLSFIPIIGEAVDAIPDDMTRKGIRITSEIDAKIVAFSNHNWMSCKSGMR